MHDLLIVPGWHNSGPHHWQTLWQHRLQARRVEQENWAEPDSSKWTATLDAAVAHADRPVVLIAHSLGVLTVLRWAHEHPASARRVAGAFLVAPPNSEVVEASQIRQFQLPPSAPLSFPSLLVGSETDHYACLCSVQRIAAAFGCEFWNAGMAGHINVASGHGEWSEGQARLATFLHQLQSRSLAA